MEEGRVVHLPVPSDPIAWQPRGGREQWEARARIMAQVREFFAERGVLEVETPILSAHGSLDSGIASFATTGADGRERWLRTSPEYAMKRMLAAGSGPIYQFGRVFRDGERGARHNPEFTMLEWYRPDFDHEDLMREVGELVEAVIPDLGQAKWVGYETAMRFIAGVNPWTVPLEALRALAREAGASEATAAGLDADGCLDLLFTHTVQPCLHEFDNGTRAIFVCDYPPSQAALARISHTPGGMHTPEGMFYAERFELFVDGVELANGYHELTDADELRERFEREVRQRRDAGEASAEIDERLLAALEHGLPACAGVALGFDRLVMLATGVDSIDETMPFPDELA